MNQIKNTITIVLKESGSVAELLKDFKIYQKSINNILLDILVPESIVESQLFTQYVDDSGAFKTQSGVYTACKIGAISTNEKGKRDKTPSYYVRYINKVTIDGKTYLLYERVLPNKLIKVAGKGENAVKLITNIVNVLVEQESLLQEPALLSKITSQTCFLEVEESEDLDQDEEVEDPSELDILSGQINSILDELPNKTDRSETFLKYSISSPLPEDITYKKDGLKTRGIFFLDETYNIKTKILETAQPQKGAVFVSDFSTKDYQLIQTEAFIYQAGVVTRTITLNSDNAEVISVGDWQTKVDSFQGKEHFGRFLYIDKNGFVNLTDAAKNFIVKNNGVMVSDDASTFDFSDNFDVVADDKERLNIDLSKKFKKEVNDRDERITTNAENIAQEIKDRTAADSTIQGNLNEEAKTRQQADETLQSNLNSETETRQSEDASIRDSVSELSEQTKNASRLESGTVADERLSSNVALKNKNNNFSSPQTFNGDITINGNITQNGETYVTHAEEVKTKNDEITLREGATGGLAKGKRAGLRFKKYDGEHDGVINIDEEGVVRVGDDGDEQPLSTREEAPNNDSFAIWNEANKRYETDSGINRTSFNAKAEKKEVTDEAKSRGDADTKLQGNIDKEVEARTDGDSALQGLIEALQGVVDALQQSLSKESSDRATGDSTLQGNIEIESNARITQDNNLQKAIDNLKEALATKANKTELGAAAFSNSFNDLDDQPIIPPGAKLYNVTGQNEDGAMTQKSATNTFETKSNAAATYETKSNASGTYLTKDSAASTYETKANVAAKIESAINALIDNAPTAYDTFKELADYISKHESVASGMLSDIGNLKTSKLDKNQGKTAANKILKVDSSGNLITTDTLDALTLAGLNFSKVNNVPTIEW